MCAKPCLIFTGDLFETDINYVRLKNLFIGKIDWDIHRSMGGCLADVGCIVLNCALALP